MNIPKQITFGELKKLPPFDRLGDTLMVVHGPMARMMDGIRLDRCPAGWSENGIRYGLEKLALALEKDQVLYPVYSTAEQEASPDKKDVQLLYFPPETDPTGKPFVVLCPGGSYYAVCAAAEGFPVAGRLAELGYPTFVLEYRVGMPPILPNAIDDLAAAVRYIKAHADHFRTGSSYVVGGFSAGGHLAALWGTDTVGFSKYGLAKPYALLLTYPLINTASPDSPDIAAVLPFLFGAGEPQPEEYDIPSHLNNYPPTYLVRCQDDLVIPESHVMAIKTALDEKGIPCDLEQGKTGLHGFGDGRGTSVEGWVDRAHWFLQSLPQKRWSVCDAPSDSAFSLSSFLKDAKKANLDIHAVCVRHDGKEVNSHHIWSQTREGIQSCTKSVVSLAAGIAVQEGLLSLNDRLTDIFPEYATEDPNDLWHTVRIRHLLTMTTGFQKDPLDQRFRNQIKEDWVSYCMRQPLQNVPGTRFQYHNASAHLVARAIQKRCGMNLRDWLMPRLFEPLSIDNPQWYMDTTGFTYGGDGLFLTVEEMAKIGQLCLSDGVWEGQQLVPAAYLREATAKQVENAGNGLTYHKDDTAGYGYFFWIADEPGVFYASGSGGQMIYCFRELNTALTVTSHLEPFYQYQLMLDLIRKSLHKKRDS